MSRLARGPFWIWLRSPAGIGRISATTRASRVRHHHPGPGTGSFYSPDATLLLEYFTTGLLEAGGVLPIRKPSGIAFRPLTLSLFAITRDTPPQVRMILTSHPTIFAPDPPGDSGLSVTSATSNSTHPV
ncbi:MAG: hypothetical protein U0401_31165 [Anaerolineae bacterium]